MINFGAQIKRQNKEMLLNPCGIYENLDRTAAAGALRDVQQEVLNDWFENHYDDKNVVVKLHTGEGKTLVGLLMLLSKLNKKQGPALYICPNIQLCNQAIKDARKFGVPYCTLTKGQKGIPIEFMNQEKILITYVQRLFNGKSIFGIGQQYEPVGTIVIDDAHACIESIHNAYTIKIEKLHNKELYDDLLTLFDDSLKAQGEGTFYDIKNGTTDDVLQVPYWAWIEHRNEVVKILGEHNEDECLTFQWPLLRNKIDCCTAYISGQSIEIIPFSFNVGQFYSYSKAGQRILMSATTQEDSFFIKDLDFDINAIKSPITSTAKKWSGEKMVLIPSLIDESLTRYVIQQRFAKTWKSTMGRFIIVPSFKFADEYQTEHDCSIMNNELLEKISEQIRNGQVNKANIIVNRYDGIDLPDDVCRILILDSLPFCENLSDRYELLVREDCEVVNRRIAQKVEQGMGRSVRSEKDYSAIILIGPDLVKFVRSKNTSKYFSDQTLQQIEIGKKIASLAREDSAEDNPMKALIDVLNQFLRRDDGWKLYYKTEMDSIIPSNVAKDRLYEIVDLENKVETAYFNREFDKALKNINKILLIKSLTKNEKAWYTQIKARIVYYNSKVESNNIQKTAFEMNHQLLKPSAGLVYKKLELKNASQIEGMKTWIEQFDNYEQLSIEVESMMSDLSFGVAAKRFEKAVANLGLLLGFNSQRPDEEIGKGPDNLWGSPKMYFMIECKNEVNLCREAINKHETAQMNSHCAWFDEFYPNANAFRVWIHPSNKLSYESSLSHEVYVFRKNELDKLKAHIRSFIKEFQRYDLKTLSEDVIHNAILAHKLSVEDLSSDYAVKVKKD